MTSTRDAVTRRGHATRSRDAVTRRGHAPRSRDAVTRRGHAMRSRDAVIVVGMTKLNTCDPVKTDNPDNPSFREFLDVQVHLFHTAIRTLTRKLSIEADTRRNAISYTTSHET